MPPSLAAPPPPAPKRVPYQHLAVELAQTARPQRRLRRTFAQIVFTNDLWITSPPSGRMITSRGGHNRLT